MSRTRRVLVITMLPITLFRGACGQEEEEPNPDINVLGEYLGEMSEKLNCYFTFEDRPDAQGAIPWLIYIDEGFTPDLNVATIDALVAKMNQELPAIKFQRSTKHPSVVHVIASDLLVEGYVMGQVVNVQYSGKIHSLSDHLGTLVDGKIESRSGFPIGLEPDVQTDVEINVENETVRDILTGAVPLTPGRRFLWESHRVVVNGSPKVRVFHYPADEEE